MRDSRRLVYVSGAPGSGKTSLAIPLAAELGYTLLAKDRIKETLHDALGAPESDLAWSRRLGGAAMELLWALAADAPAVVIEANFRPHSEYEKAKLSDLAARPVEVHCACRPRPEPVISMTQIGGCQSVRALNDIVPAACPGWNL